MHSGNGGKENGVIAAHHDRHRAVGSELGNMATHLDKCRHQIVRDHRGVTGIAQTIR